ncbi:MAG: PTS-dependent dihydroxyacetone kinase phosphotransferase subunit DhaM [Chloroflexota bacterium]|jgi:dihydroxyacetone kinase phosphotransfer subunit|nr:MAG: PTS-dependent dihydroxyacetone kinase phosphotransferase subunit DhaM [Chloroflexota bacterium]
MLASAARVGIVVVSHSRRLAEGVAELAAQMADASVRIVPVGGAADGSLGTDADGIVAGLRAADGGAGVVVVADIGSAVLAAETAIELLGDGIAERVRISRGPVAEGAVVAAVQASIGQTLDEVLAAAEAAAEMDKGVTR